MYEIRHLRGERIDDFDLEVKRGEVVGLAGLLGSGIEDLPYLLFGTLPGESGEVVVDGERSPVSALTPRRNIERGVGLVPGNRLADGLATDVTLWENMFFLVNKQHFRRGFLRRSEIRAAGARACAEFDVLPPDPGTAVSNLSGGNQQKVLIAKWCQIDPKVLLLHEPTQGVDVGARETIHTIIRRIAARGTAVLWFSDDYREMTGVADRIVAVVRGRISCELRGEQQTAEAVAHAVVGVEQSKEVLGA